MWGSVIFAAPLMHDTRRNNSRRPGQAKRRAGTHNHRVWFGEDSEWQGCRNNSGRWLWVPAFAGTTAEIVALATRSPYLLPLREKVAPEARRMRGLYPLGRCRLRR